eukprot:6176671-Pleurochrysis_carterae.AAC.1
MVQPHAARRAHSLRSRASPTRPILRRQRRGQARAMARAHAREHARTQARARAHAHAHAHAVCAGAREREWARLNPEPYTHARSERPDATRGRRGQTQHARAAHARARRRHAHRESRSRIQVRVRFD